MPSWATMPYRPPSETAVEQALSQAGHDFVPIAFQISSLGFAISAQFKTGLAPFDIEPRQFFMLRTVSTMAGQSQKALAERLRVPTSSMVAAIDDLESRGLIERRPEPEDRRVRALYLTPEGDELMRKIMPVAMSIEQAIRSELSPEDATKLAELLLAVGPAFGVTPGAAHSATQHEAS